MQQLQNVIETAFERRADITPVNVDTVTREAVNRSFLYLIPARCVSQKNRRSVGHSPVVEESGSALFPY